MIDSSLTPSLNDSRKDIKKGRCLRIDLTRNIGFVSRDLPQRQQALLLQFKDFLHHTPLLMAGQRRVGTLRLGDEGLPLRLTGHGSKTLPVLLPVEVIDGVANHKHMGTTAVYLHIENPHLLLTLHNLGPYLLMDVTVAPDHVRVVHQFECLTVSLHIFLFLIFFYIEINEIT